jgi:hypothetical protein
MTTCARTACSSQECTLFTFQKKNMFNRYKNQNEILVDEHAITILIHRAAENCFVSKLLKSTQPKIKTLNVVNLQACLFSEHTVLYPVFCNN